MDRFLRNAYSDYSANWGASQQRVTCSSNFSMRHTQTTLHQMPTQLQPSYGMGAMPISARMGTDQVVVQRSVDRIIG